MQAAAQGLLSRHKSLGIRQVRADVIVHPERDPGVYLNPEKMLNPFASSYSHALVLVDREGSGVDPTINLQDMEKSIESKLARIGWQDRVVAVVLDPELEIWIWSDSPLVDQYLGWSNRQPNLRQWLQHKGYLPPDQPKPTQPKNALESALRQVHQPRSSSLYKKLAENVGLDRCNDKSFIRFRETLRRWFPV